MVVECVIIGCRNRVSKIGAGSGISLHRFPKDAVIRKKWEKAINRGPGWKAARHHVVCSDHFEAHMFSRAGGVPRLFQGAVPTIFKPHQDSGGIQKLTNGQIDVSGPPKDPLAFDEPDTLSSETLTASSFVKPESFLFEDDEIFSPELFIKSDTADEELNEWQSEEFAYPGLKMLLSKPVVIREPSLAAIIHDHSFVKAKFLINSGYIHTSTQTNMGETSAIAIQKTLNENSELKTMIKRYKNVLLKAKKKIRTLNQVKKKLMSRNKRLKDIMRGKCSDSSDESNNSHSEDCGSEITPFTLSAETEEYFKK